jgi:hypothetical protein
MDVPDAAGSADDPHRIADHHRSPENVRRHETMRCDTRGIGLPYGGWSAYVSAAAVFLAGVLVPALVPEMVPGAVFNTLEGISTLILILSMLPIALSLHQLHRVSKPGLSMLALLIGIVAMLTGTGVQVLLLVGIAQPGGLSDQLGHIALGGVGVWLLLNGYLTSTGRALPRELGWLSIAAGAGFVLVTLGFLVSNPLPAWAAAAGIVMVVTYLLWAAWLGRLLLSNTLAVSG